MAAQNTLKGTTWTVTHETSGSRGQLVLNGDTTGTYNNSPSSSPIVWAESWVGNYCYLWVVFKSSIDGNVIKIWGLQMTLQGGAGMSAMGNATPADPANTSFMNDNLTIVPQS